MPNARRALLGAAAALAVAAAAAPAAAAQTQAQAAQAGSPPPSIVISGRDSRMSLFGAVGVRIGCFGPAEEACTGSVQLRLARAVTAPGIRPPGVPRTRRVPDRRVAPYALSTVQFGLGGGGARLLFFRLLPRTRFLTRQLGELPVSVVVTYSGRNGGPFTERREIKMYVPRAFVYPRGL